MVTRVKSDPEVRIQLFQGLNDTEMTQIYAICEEKTYAAGELCQKEGESSGKVYFILDGRVGTVTRIPNINYYSSEIFLDTLTVGDSFGWLALFKSTPLASLKTIEPTRVLSANTEDILKLCEDNPRLGYVFMRNLASLISSRLRRNRMATLNALVAIKGDW